MANNWEDNMDHTALMYHPAFLAHDAGPGHPERAQRLVAITERLDADGLLKSLVQPELVEATVESVTRVHAKAYVERIQQQSRTGRHFYADADTVGSGATYRAALIAAGAVQQAVDMVMKGEAKNGFCAVRPPGHHAEHAQAMGFCFFNNVAIAARYLQDHHGLTKIAILDWDVHHGNGTQNAFYGDPSVFYFSVHQYPHYPGSGRRSETGANAGEGFTLNVPLATGSTDTDYLRVFKEDLRPAIQKFAPEFVLLSAGFDAHEVDPLSGMLVSTDGFRELTSLVMAMSDELAGGRLVSVLEGGYSLAALADSISAHVGVLAGT